MIHDVKGGSSHIYGSHNLGSIHTSSIPWWELHFFLRVHNRQIFLAQFPIVTRLKH